MIVFCMNPTSWVNGAVVPGGMADCLVQPILPHLEHDYTFDRAGHNFTTNVYYSHRKKYGQVRPAGERSVFVSHGIGDKGWRNPARMAGQWDFITVSGPAWSMKYLVGRGIDPSRIIEVGYTKLDPLFNGDIEAPKRDGRIRVVWAPTHGGGGERTPGTPGHVAMKASAFSSHHRGGEILERLPESEFDVVVARHPRHRPDGRSTLSEYAGADVVIADGGSTIYEAWALDLPVVFPTWMTGPAFTGARSTMEGDVYTDRIGWHVDDPDDLAATVAAAADMGITDPERDFIEPIFPRKYRGVSGRLHAEVLDDITARRDVRHAAEFQRRTWMKIHGEHLVEVIVGSRIDQRFCRNPRYQEVTA